MTKRRLLGINSSSRPKAFKAQRKSNGDKMLKKTNSEWAMNRTEKVRRMLAAMEHQVNQAAGQSDGAANNPDSEQFFSTGRTGRRNALPDILGDHAHVTSSDLPARLQALTTTETNKINLPEDQPGPSRHTPEQN